MTRVFTRGRDERQRERRQREGRGEEEQMYTRETRRDIEREMEVTRNLKQLKLQGCCE